MNILGHLTDSFDHYQTPQHDLLTVLDVVVSALAAPEPAVVVAASRLLRNATRVATTRRAAWQDGSGVLEALVAAMHRLPSDVNVQDWGCRALINIVGCLESAARAGAVGAIPVVLACLSAPEPFQAAVHEHACWALRHLAQLPANQHLAGQAGAVATLVTVIVARVRAKAPAPEAGAVELTAAALAPTMSHAAATAAAVVTSRVLHAAAAPDGQIARTETPVVGFAPSVLSAGDASGSAAATPGTSKVDRDPVAELPKPLAGMDVGSGRSVDIVLDHACRALAQLLWMCPDNVARLRTMQVVGMPMAEAMEVAAALTSAEGALAVQTMRMHLMGLTAANRKKCVIRGKR